MIDVILASIAANAIVLGALGFLFKSLITHFLDKDISTFKRSLEDKAQREIESYKSQLETERLRLQISYGGIFEKQANAILDLYKGLTSLERVAFDAINSGSNSDESRENFRKVWSSLRQNNVENRILLPENIDEAMSKFIDDMFRNVFAYTRIQDRDLRYVSETEANSLMEKQIEAANIIERELPALLNLLIASMRKTLGVVN